MELERRERQIEQEHQCVQGLRPTVDQGEAEGLVGATPHNGLLKREDQALKEDRGARRFPADHGGQQEERTLLFLRIPSAPFWDKLD